MADLRLTARLNPSALDARRGVVRAHAEVLTALGLREWDGIALTGARRSAAVIALAPAQTPAGVVLVDDITLSNLGLKEDATVVVAPTTVYGARSVTVHGSTLAAQSINAINLRQALLGKVVSVGDAVSLLPRDLGPGTSTSAITQTLARNMGVQWTSELVTVTATDPAGEPVSIQPNTAVHWRDAQTASAAAPSTPPVSVPAVTDPAPVAIADLIGVQDQAAKLSEWLELTLDQPDLLRKLGAAPRLGVVITGPAGVGKTTLARSVIGKRNHVTLDGPTVGATEPGARLRAVTDAIAQLADKGVLLISDIDALLPTDPQPVSALVLEALKAAVATPGLAVIATTAHPDATDPRVRAPELCDRELPLPLPDAKIRGALLAMLLREVPSDQLKLDDIAARTPGFVVADLHAVCREAAVRAAGRAHADKTDPVLTQADLVGALAVIRPLSRSSSEELAIGKITLDDVGDMVETKQALTEAVLWPLRHADSFARLGVDPPRGVLLYGPPGCGKTFLVRALASTGQVSVHAVKGAELMDKWVGSSERAVRELFQRARDSAPSLIFLDEIDALAPRRGQTSDSGVGDRVVAALLTELDGAEPLRNVVVVGATNRPELIDPALLRPGRLEKLVFVPPPDAEARAEILRTASRSVPLAADVDLPALAAELDGYSAADCAAVLREAALAAMRRDVDTPDVSAADVETARTKVRPSLDPVQVEALRSYADRRDS